MTREQFQREECFQVTIYLLRQALLMGLITEEDFAWCIMKMIDIYNPVIGCIIR